MKNRYYNGRVVADTTDDGLHGFIVGLVCNTEKFSKTSMMANLADMILYNALLHKPDTIGELLSLEIVKWKDAYEKNTFIEDAINEANSTYNEDIYIDFYHKESITLGLNYFKIITRINPTYDTASLVIFGGGGIDKKDPYSVYNNLTYVLDQINLTNPLTTRIGYLHDGLVEHIKSCIKAKLQKQEFITYTDYITGKVVKKPSSDLNALEKVIEKEFKIFRECHLLEDQYLLIPPLSQKKENQDKKIINYLIDYNSWIHKDFIRYSLKNLSEDETCPF